MYSIIEEIKHMKWYYASKQGVLSTYFLACMMYVVTIVITIASCDKALLETLINMKEANLYFQQEIQVIQDVKQKLLQDIPLEETQLDSLVYTIEIEDDILYVSIDSQYPQLLIITMDLETKMLLDYECIRDYH